MRENRSNGWTSPLELSVLCFGLMLIFVLLNESYGINLMDEGFLWYGAQRTAVGEVPEETIANLGLLYGPILAILYFAGVAVLYFYRIDRRPHLANLEKLASRESNSTDAR